MFDCNTALHLTWLFTNLNRLFSEFSSFWLIKFHILFVELLVDKLVSQPNDCALHLVRYVKRHFPHLLTEHVNGSLVTMSTQFNRLICFSMSELSFSFARRNCLTCRGKLSYTSQWCNATVAIDQRRLPIAPILATCITFLDNLTDISILDWCCSVAESSVRWSGVHHVETSDGQELPPVERRGIHARLP